jgi:hypothetical protein
LQKCENNITFDYFARSYSKLMLNKIKLMWKELLSFIHFMGPSSKKISKNFKLIQDVWKYFELIQIFQNIYKYINKPSWDLFVYIMGEHYMNFIHDDVGNDVEDVIHDINIIILSLHGHKR